VTTRKQRIKVADKIRALELLGKRHKLFVDKVESDNVTRMGKLTDEERASRVSSILATAAPRVKTENAA
jgi:hypothetical protein